MFPVHSVYKVWRKQITEGGDRGDVSIFDIERSAKERKSIVDREEGLLSFVTEAETSVFRSIDGGHPRDGFGFLFEGECFFAAMAFGVGRDQAVGKVGPGA